MRNAHTHYQRFKASIVFGAALAVSLLFAGTYYLSTSVYAPNAIACPLRHFNEYRTYLAQPDAKTAFNIGEKHFSALKASTYDIECASYYFEKAAELDAGYPYLSHERARVAFLHGNYTTAMRLIDDQISRMGDSAPNSYYIRGLIKGFDGQYVAAADDFKRYLSYYPHNWAAMNDYAWVLLRAHDFSEAASILRIGLEKNPLNPWLLNAYAIALYELGNTSEALEFSKSAVTEIANLHEGDWLKAYPGNDPKAAGEGLRTFKKAVEGNFAKISSGR